MFGLASRVVAGAILATMTAALLGVGMKWSRTEIKLYLITGSSFFFAMFLIYWAMQFIPSGWVSLLYGFMPIATALIARMWLQSESLSYHRLIGMAFGLIGLTSIFSSGINLNPEAAMGIGAVLLSVTMHAGSNVWVKKQQADMPVIVLTSGGLLVAAPMFIIMWLLNGAVVPAHPSAKTLWSIGYLALFGSVLGFTLYYYVLKHIDTTRTSLITLIAPISALALGHILNGEPLTPEVVAGALFTLTGLALFELGHHIPRFGQQSKP